MALYLGKDLVSASSGIPTAPTGGVVSWDDLTDKPFGKSTETYYAVKWDGDITNRVTAADKYDTFVHISDIVPTMDDINKGAALHDKMGKWTANFFIEENGYIYEEGNMAVIVPADNFDAWGDGSLIFPKKGIYFLYDIEWGCTAFELKDFELFELYTRTAIAKLDEVFLPSTIPVIAQVADADTSTGSALISHTYEQLLDLMINGANLYVQNYSALFDPYFEPMDDDGRLVFNSFSGLIPFAKRLMYISPDNSVEFEDYYESEILLQSPNGTAYKITVSDTGSITAQRV